MTPAPSDWRSRVLAVVQEHGPAHCRTILGRITGVYHNSGYGTAYRAIDRALQSLRRAGLVVYDRQRGWSVK